MYSLCYYQSIVSKWNTLFVITNNCLTISHQRRGEDFKQNLTRINVTRLLWFQINYLLLLRTYYSSVIYYYTLSKHGRRMHLEFSSLFTYHRWQSSSIDHSWETNRRARVKLHLLYLTIHRTASMYYLLFPTSIIPSVLSLLSSERSLYDQFSSMRCKLPVNSDKPPGTYLIKFP